MFSSVRDIIINVGTYLEYCEGYHEYHRGGGGGHEYRGGYLEYHWGYAAPWGYHEYCGGVQYLVGDSILGNLSTVWNIMIHTLHGDIMIPSHGTEYPPLYTLYPPRY